MNKHTLNQYQKWLGLNWKKYSEILLITNIRPCFKFVQGLDALMEFQFRYPYLDSEVRYGESIITLWQKNKHEARAVLLHEMMHGITDPLYAKAVDRYVGKNEIEDERERLCDHLSHIFLKILDQT